MILQAQIFNNLQFVLDLPITSAYKTKQALKESIIKEKGIVCYIVNRNVHYVVRDLNDDDSYKSRRAVKYDIPVVGIDFIQECVKARALLDWRKFVPDAQKANVKADINDGIIHVKSNFTKPVKSHFQFSAVKVWAYREAQGPPFHQLDHSIAKVAVLNGRNKKMLLPFAVLELHVLIGSSENVNMPNFCIFVHHGTLSMSDKKVIGQKDCRFFKAADHALLAYQHVFKLYSSPPHSMQRALNTFDARLGSDYFYPEEWLPTLPILDPQVACLVEYIWSEAAKEIENTIAVDLKTISRDNVEKAKTLLQEISNCASTDAQTAEFDKHQELRDILPFKGFSDLKSHVKKCQHLQDVLALREMMENCTETIEDQYRALRCHIEPLRVTDDEYRQIKNLVMQAESKIIVDCAYKIHRHVEYSKFCKETGSERLLFRGVPVKNMISTLSHGFLPTEVDFSPQFSGVHFSTSMESAIKEAEKSNVKGTRMIAVCQVALGNQLQVNAKHTIPDAKDFQSIHCVKCSDDMSDFEEEKFIILNVNQQKILYLIECHLPDDAITQIKPPVCNQLPKKIDQVQTDGLFSHKNVDLHDYLYSKPNANIKPGLQSTGSETIPLKSIHVRAKLVDLAAEVVLVQEYVNASQSTIEVKYVFPLDDRAAVCGFEAFTEGRHFMGRIEEKQTARQEYQQAVDAGQKAFLMEEESPDIFSIKIGTVSPGAVVLTKITYVTELELEGDLIKFQVSGSVAPPQKDCPNADDVVNMTATDDLQTSVELSLDMPFPIRMITSCTHKLISKKTETRAVVAINRNDKLDTGFQLLVGLSEIHKPRMWVEEHPTLNTEACMLTFYPEFDVESLKETEIIIAVDTSNSMAGDPFKNAVDIALLTLHFLPQECKFNVVKFGTVYEEFFPTVVAHSMETVNEAEQFVLNLQPQSGNSELSHLLQTYYLLPPSTAVRNILLVSDGHFNGADELFAAAAAHRQQTRIFTLAVGSNSNRHLLRSLAFSGGGAYEHFDGRLKPKWDNKVKNIIANTQEPVLTNISVEWQQFNNFDPPPTQAPKLITSVFNGNRLIVYGFVANCTLATLKAIVNGVEVTSVVNTTELAKSKGNVVSALTTRALVQDWEEGCLAINRTQHEVLKRSLKPQIVALSKEYNIVTSLTSFVAVENKDELHDKEGSATLDELLKLHDIDFLDYIDYDTNSHQKECFFLNTDMYEEMYEEDTDEEGMSAASSLEQSRSVSPDREIRAFEDADDDVQEAEWQSITKQQRKKCRAAVAKKTHDKVIKGFQIAQSNPFDTLSEGIKPKGRRFSPFLSEIWDISDTEISMTKACKSSSKDSAPVKQTNLSKQNEPSKHQHLDVSSKGEFPTLLEARHLFRMPRSTIQPPPAPPFVSRSTKCSAPPTPLFEQPARPTLFQRLAQQQDRSSSTRRLGNTPPIPQPYSLNTSEDIAMSDVLTKDANPQKKQTGLMGFGYYTGSSPFGSTSTQDAAAGQPTGSIFSTSATTSLPLKQSTVKFGQATERRPYISSCSFAPQATTESNFKAMNVGSDGGFVPPQMPNSQESGFAVPAFPSMQKQTLHFTGDQLPSGIKGTSPVTFGSYPAVPDSVPPASCSSLFGSPKVRRGLSSLHASGYMQVYSSASLMPTCPAMAPALPPVIKHGDESQGLSQTINGYLPPRLKSCLGGERPVSLQSEETFGSDFDALCCTDSTDGNESSIVGAQGYMHMGVSSSSASKRFSAEHFKCKKTFGLGVGGAKRYRRVIYDDPNPLCKQLILEESTISLGSGLPLISTLLKLFPKENWKYKEVWQRERQLMEIALPSDPQLHKPLQDILHACNELGGIRKSKLPPSLVLFVEHATEYLESVGLRTTSSSVQEAATTLVASLAAIFTMCHEISPSSFPLDLSDPDTIKDQAGEILNILCRKYPEWVHFLFYGLLVYIKWVNQSFPLLYDTLELGNCWEKALQNLMNRLHE